MARGALLTGAVGGIIGALTAGIGIIWSIMPLAITSAKNGLLNEYGMFYGALQYVNFKPDLITRMLPYEWSMFTYHLLVINSRVALFFWYSLMLGPLLIVSCILTGMGFYGVYQAGGGAMGLVGLIFGIIGGAAGGTLIILGNTLQTSTPYLFFWVFLVNEPNYIIIYMGLVTLAVSFILLGASSIAVRETTAHPSAATFAGVSSIVGACFLLLYIPAIIGFVLILSAFAIWAGVFYGSRNV